MAKRPVQLDPDRFALLFFSVLDESEEQDDTLSDEELEDIGMMAFENRPMAKSFMLRFLGLVGQFERMQEEGFIREVGESIKFHPAVLETAATLRAKPNGRFPDQLFVDRVKEYAEGKFSDFEFGV